MFVSVPVLVALALLYPVAATVGAMMVALSAARRLELLRGENARLRARLMLPSAPEDDFLADDEAPGFRSARVGTRALVPAIAVVAALAFAAGDARAQSAPDAAAENAALYCRNIADAAADARFSRQQQALATMEKQVEERIAQLEAKKAEYQDWLMRRETFLKKADETLIAVFSQMRPDAAAAQMSAMQEDIAAAILARLSPRVASAILNEIDAARAAKLTATMVGLARRQDNRAQDSRGTDPRGQDPRAKGGQPG